jgi:hypothetical protein
MIANVQSTKPFNHTKASTKNHVDASSGHMHLVTTTVCKLTKTLTSMIEQ